MSIPRGTKVIVNSEVNIAGITPGNTYEAQGGLGELEGASVISDSGTIKYLSRSQFHLEGEEDVSGKETNGDSPKVSGVGRFLRPES